MIVYVGIEGDENKPSSGQNAANKEDLIHSSPCPMDFVLANPMTFRTSFPLPV